MVCNSFGALATFVLVSMRCCVALCWPVRWRPSYRVSLPSACAGMPVALPRDCLSLALRNLGMSVRQAR